MNTQQTKQSNFTGVVLVLFVAWLLFGNGVQVVLLLTQQAQQRLEAQQQPLVITLPTANVTQPMQATSVQPDPEVLGHIAPLTLDMPPATAPEVPAQIEQPAAPQPTLEPTIAPVVAEQPAPPAQAEQPAVPQPTLEPTSAPLVAAAPPQQDDKLLIDGRGEPNWAAMAATARPQCVSGCDTEIGKLMQQQLEQP